MSFLNFDFAGWYNNYGKSAPIFVITFFSTLVRFDGFDRKWCRESVGKLLPVTLRHPPTPPYSYPISSATFSEIGSDVYYRNQWDRTKVAKKPITKYVSLSIGKIGFRKENISLFQFTLEVNAMVRSTRNNLFQPTVETPVF